MNAQELLQLVRSEGTELSDDDLQESDLILPPSDLTFAEAGEYRKVEPGRLLEFDMSLARGGTVFSRTRCTVEFLDRGVGTQLVLTDEGDSAGEHATGWGPALDHLAQLLG